MRGLFVSALLAAGAGLQFARRRYADKGPEECSNCSATFDFIGRTRIVCGLTGEILCKDCVEYFLPSIPIHKERYQELKDSVESVVCTKDKEIPGSRNYKVLGRVSSSKSHRDRNKAVEDLKFQCVKLGGDALLELEIHKETSWISSNAQQIPGMTLQSSSNNYCADGMAVVFLEGARPVRHDYPVADEILKFAELLDKGLITRDEFDHQKAVLLGTLEHCDDKQDHKSKMPEENNVAEKEPAIGADS
tara:strand:+ start:109 stop:852 length:744 start_codon:yes stop_codon:yes gene_type:complete